MPRFVLLEHDHPHLHWDLMLQVGEVLWTWRLEEPLPAGRAVNSARTFDHRPIYLEYEGPVSSDRGQVVRRQSGEYAWLEEREGQMAAQVTGSLTGRLELRQMEGDRWQITFQPEDALLSS